MYPAEYSTPKGIVKCKVRYTSNCTENAGGDSNVHINKEEMATHLVPSIEYPGCVPESSADTAPYLIPL